MFVIFNFSNENAELSADNSDRLIIKTIETIKHTKLSEEEKEIILDKFTIYIRKGAHLFLYFVLGILAFNLHYKIYGLQPITFIYTIIFCFVYACTDEIHQLFIDGRSGEVLDVFIDTIGAFLSTSFLYLIKKKKSN